MLRASPLFPLDHGHHTCVFYRTDDELLEFLVPYFAKGLRKGEYCFGAQKPHIRERLFTGLRWFGIDTKEYIRRGAFDIHTDEEVYFSHNKFDPGAMIDMLLCAMDEALAKGFTALRSAGELTWAISSPDMWAQVLDYEARVDHCFPGRAMTGICQYNAAACSSGDFDAVVERHYSHVCDTSPGSSHTHITVRNEDHWADVIADQAAPNPNFYYVVQPRHTAEPVGWGIAPTFEFATENAQRIVTGDHKRS